MTSLYHPFLFPPWLFGYFGMELSDMMTDTADETKPRPDTAPDSNVTAPLFKRVTRMPHDWGKSDPVPAEQVDYGREQIARVCNRCKLVRLTIIGAQMGRERGFRVEDGDIFFGAEPECFTTLTDMGCRP